MNYIASITSQGQLTIPKPLRKKYFLDKKSKAIIKSSGAKIEIRPLPHQDLLSLRGILHDNPVVKANRGKPLQQIIEEESAAFETAIAQNVAKEMGLPPLTEWNDATST
ncbi:MAG: Transcriptional regulator, AbrB family [Candidatus Magasanikbacteria bacterium GW2011_GWA2_45_39]|uniref:Transcriptional regulator, AbrB family n=1 Tax=Candidatus Magasanikbacteria bacterium GW2011_GWA2_45_39 TaxID=1619041 RepID=A0A0G1MDP7_9BACT|nr:MAG: Transcriptional regulator, AbrB family [Candidatus Magasanikbacteria bacterium GW2011_GWA2_45_39]